MAVQAKSMTVEEFWEHYAGKLYELVRVEIVQVTPTGISHGAVTRRIGTLLGVFVDAHGLGEVVGAETGFWLTPDTLRAPDCAYISTEKMSSLTEAERYAPFAPDLAVEFVSPGDTASDIRDKVDLYRAAGTRLVWVIYPALRKVDVYLPDGTAREVGAQGTLDGGDVLPGLQNAVKDVFPAG
jgi:Uma2 family endonuclease